MTTKIPDTLLVSGGGGGGGGGLVPANNLSDLTSIPTARTNLGLGTLATQNGTVSGTHSGNSSGTNTGDQDLSGYLTKAANLSGLASAATARTNLGLGTLATQNGTFSGTSSGTNTGDQVISDATLSTSDVTTNNASTSKHGFLPKLSGVGSQFMAGDGSWSTPAGGGDVGGPASAVADHVVTFNGTTGKIIKDSGLSLSGNNTGDQTIALTGDVTGSGTGSFAATIANDAVTNAKLANMATKTYKGRTTAATGDPEDVPVATLKTDLGLVKADVGLSNVDNTADSTKSVADSVKWAGHPLTVSSSAPSGGADGDIWFQYTP